MAVMTDSVCEQNLVQPIPQQEEESWALRTLWFAADGRRSVSVGRYVPVGRHVLLPDDTDCADAIFGRCQWSGCRLGWMKLPRTVTALAISKGQKPDYRRFLSRLNE